MLKSIVQSLVQDAATAAAGYFSAHGFITADQTQGLIGSVVFLAMLIFNAVMQHKQKDEKNV